GSCARLRDLDIYQFAVPDEGGLTIRRYMRYPLPQIIVDGDDCGDPFPMSGDEVAPGKIWGTADVMVESNVRFSNGVDAKQRVLAWSQPGHDDYVIWDWTFVNTGNVDRDDEIELPGQTLDSVYIARVTEAMSNGTGNNKALSTYAGTTENQDTRLSYPQDDDSLRIDYVTPLRTGGLTRDSYGFNAASSEWNVLTGARFAGTATLFAPKSIDVPQNYPISNITASNDPAQPSMRTSMLAEPSWILLHNGILADFNTMEPWEHLDAYEVMKKGVFGIDTTIPNYQETYSMDSVYDIYDTTASGAKTYYEQPIDRWGELDPDRGYAFASEISWIRFDQQGHFSIGPYQMGFGDTLRFVYAYVGGAISRKTSYLLGEAWDGGTAASWLPGMDSAQMVDELRKRDPIFDVYYTSPRLSPAPTINDIAKDLLVASGKDSLFNNGMNAQRNFNVNYDIPASPAPPSVFEVTSMPDMIRLTWSYDDGIVPPPAPAKFKIYRASGDYVYSKQGEIVTGEWQLIDSVDGNLDTYEDTDVAPAHDYYYSITAVSSSGVESGMFLTMTKLAAQLQSYPGDSLEAIRVVPNPLNTNSSGRTRYPEGEGLKLAFVELPPECRITILTESGNLVTTIDHINGSGTEIWEFSNQFLLTDSDQHPASGIYIAHIRTPDGRSIARKFVIIR
ncbi:fibronectin type III domain-containing protein, partial [candidate division WOR-3 bacterium]|nr:fibronectin type III domain-containing protein [candidate division WOR-3 bacterium]